MDKLTDALTNSRSQIVDEIVPETLSKVTAPKLKDFTIDDVVLQAHLNLDRIKELREVNDVRVSTARGHFLRLVNHTNAESRRLDAVEDAIKASLNHIPDVM